MDSNGHLPFFFFFFLPFRPICSCSVHSEQKEQFATTCFTAKQELVQKGTLQSSDQNYELDAAR